LCGIESIKRLGINLETIRFRNNMSLDSISDLKYLTKNAKNESGAEAYYLLAEYYYSNKDFNEVEKLSNLGKQILKGLK
jgi:hypothetical protein